MKEADRLAAIRAAFAEAKPWIDLPGGLVALPEEVFRRLVERVRAALEAEQSG